MKRFSQPRTQFIRFQILNKQHIDFKSLILTEFIIHKNDRLPQIDGASDMMDSKWSQTYEHSRNIACTNEGRSADFGCFQRQNEGIKNTQHQHRQNNGSDRFTTVSTESNSRLKDSAELLSAKPKSLRQQPYASVTTNSAKRNTWQSVSEKLHIPQIDGNDDGSDIQEPEADRKTLDTNSPVATSQTLLNSSNQNMTEGDLKTKSVGQSLQNKVQNKANQASAIETTRADPQVEVSGASQSLQRSQKSTRRAKKKKQSKNKGTGQGNSPDIKLGVSGRFGALSVQVSPESRALDTSRNESNAGGEFSNYSVISTDKCMFFTAAKQNLLLQISACLKNRIACQNGVILGGHTWRSMAESWVQRLKVSKTKVLCWYIDSIVLNNSARGHSTVMRSLVQLSTNHHNLIETRLGWSAFHEVIQVEEFELRSFELRYCLLC